MRKMPKCLVEIGVNEDILEDIELSSDIVLRQLKDYGFDEREVYDLAHESALWLYSHIKMYKDLSGDLLELNDNVYKVDGSALTFEKCIEEILLCLKLYLSEIDSCDEESECELKSKLSRAFIIYGKIINDIWW